MNRGWCDCFHTPTNPYERVFEYLQTSLFPFCSTSEDVSKDKLVTNVTDFLKAQSFSRNAGDEQCVKIKCFFGNFFQLWINTY